MNLSGKITQNPLVTALICNYNYGCYLGEAIDSALAQTWKKLEVLVIDDGSTDDSREVLKRYDGRIRTILKENGGQASAFNAGIAEARGEIICFLDSDDTWNPEKVERAVAKYQEAPWGLVCHDMKIIDSKGASLRGVTWTELAGIRLRSGDLLHQLVDNGYPWTFSPTAGICLPALIAHKILPLPEAGWRICADNPLAYAAACHAPVGVIDSTLGSYRVHNSNGFANVYGDTRSNLVFSVIHPLQRYFFLQSYIKSLGGALTKSPKENYRYYRRWCFIASRRPWRLASRLWKKNIHHFKLLDTKGAWMKIMFFWVMDTLILFSLILKVPNKYLKCRAQFRTKLAHLDKVTQDFLTDENE